MKKLLLIFGTRPEAIKMASLYYALKKNAKFDVKICVTAQHREMLDQVLTFFNITPDFDLDLMSQNQNLNQLTGNILTKLEDVYKLYQPDIVFVHGDTTTTLASSLSAFYKGIKICHVEAGLRTFDKFSPFPEEINRQLTTKLADYHFAPTIDSYNNLINEGIPKKDILITGNTVIDSLYLGLEKLKNFNSKELEEIVHKIDSTKKTILITAHRRENHGQGIVNICQAIRKLCNEFDEIQVVIPVHPNPNVKKIIFNELQNIQNIILLSPLSYPSFIWLMSHSYIILTDSGGIQEEAPSLGKPILLLRENSERPEAIISGNVILVGTDVDKIYSKCKNLLLNNDDYSKISEISNPYGDGKAAQKIANFIGELS